MFFGLHIQMILLLVPITQLRAEIERCDNELCNYEAHCELQNDKPHCDCVGKKYFTGVNCTEQVDSCKTASPCKNGAQCKNAIGQAVCICENNFGGQFCDVDGGAFTSMYFHHNRLGFQAVHQQFMFTVAKLGKKAFRLELNSDNYAIAMVVTDPAKPTTAWTQSTTLDEIAKRSGLNHPNNLPYRQGYYYIADATFWTVGLQELRVKVTDLDSQKTFFENSYQIHIHNVSHRCRPDVELLHCSDPFKPMQLDVARFNMIKVRVNKRCHSGSKMQYEWDVHSTVETALLHTYGITKTPRLKIPPYPSWTNFLGELAQSFLFRITITETITGEDDTHIVARCYVFIIPKPVVAEIVGGMGREIASGQTIVLDGSRSRDLAYSPLTRSRLRYTWSCSSANDPWNPDCFEGMSKDSVLTIPAGNLRFGKTYKFLLEVESRINADSRDNYTQTVKVARRRPLYVSIECVRNCFRKKFEPSRMLHVAARCIDCESHVTLKYKWKFNGRPEEQKRRLIIKEAPNVEELSIELTILYQGRRGKTEIILQNNSPPKGGKCNVKPDAGEEGVTLFEITCDGYNDDDQPLRYEFYSGAIPLDRTSEPYTKVHLSGKSNLRVQICDSLSSCTSETVKANVEKYKGEMDLLPFLQQPDFDIVRLYRDGSISQAIVLTHVAAEKIKGPNDAHTLATRMQRFTLLNLVHIEQFIGAMMPVFNTLTPFDNRGAIVVEKFFQTLGNGFEKLIADGDVNEMSLLTYEGIQANLAYIMSSMTKQTEHINIPHIFEGIRAHAYGRLEEIHEVIGVEDVHIVARLENWVEMGKQVDRCIRLLGHIASHLSEPEEPNIVTDVGTLQIETRFFDQGDAQYIASKDGVAKIFVDTSSIFDLEYIIGSSRILLQSITSEANPYWWCPERHPISTGVLHFSAFNELADNQFRHGLQLHESFAVLLKTQELPDSRQIERTHMRGRLLSRHDFNVFRIVVPKNALLIITFVFAELDLRVLTERGHQLSGYDVSKSSNIIKKFSLNESPPSPLLYLNTESDEYLYLGVLAAGSASPESSLFAFVPELRECLSWKFNIPDPSWTTDDCWPRETANLTGGHLICYCQHMSTYAGKIFPIPAFALYGVGDLRDELPTNWFMVGLQMGVGLIFIGWILIAYLCLAPNRERLVISPKTEDDDFMMIDEPTGEVAVRFTTGGYRNSSTTAGIIFVISTVNGNMKYKIYQNPANPLLKRHSTTTVVLPINPQDLTRPISFSIRHDGGGRYASWFCRYVEVDYPGNPSAIRIEIDSWIPETELLCTEGQAPKRTKKNPKWKTFNHHLEVITTNWFCFNPLFGPWKYGNATCNRFERTLIWMAKIAIAFLVVAFFFGWTMLSNYEDERKKYRFIIIDPTDALRMALLSFVFGSLIQFGVEFWMSRFSRDSNEVL